ncbi:MAG TPA: gluconate 2-dehydrogenase subunit 3 family protein [Acidimicrobiales bacterium]|nr:gluconate 2-dehydrogenase subunit 3 family protein [Acidimicrobiales bacterium]
MHDGGGGDPAGRITRRRFLAAALAGGAAAFVPALPAAGASPPPPGGWFLVDRAGKPRRSTCTAACARIVPPGPDPATEPGATEAGAVVAIDMFLAAFELPAAVADGPAVWIHGRWSGRNPYPDNSTGRPSSTYPASDMVERSGRRRFLPLDRWEEAAWRGTLYGRSALPGWTSPRWRGQLGRLTPGFEDLRSVYAEGLDALDAYSRETFSAPFAEAQPAEQDAMLESAGGLPASALPLPSPPGAPDAAKTLFPFLALHTYQACYGLPEYGGNRGGAMWRAIGWDGDTQPLGNTIFDRSAAGGGEGPNAGFGEEGVFVPYGDYREYRAVSGPDPSPAVLPAGVAEAVLSAWRRAGLTP